MRPIFIFLLLLAVTFSIGQIGQPYLRFNTNMHSAKTGKVSVDASGKYVLTSSNDKTARVWDAETGKLIKILRPPVGKGNTGMLYACALSPGGKYAAVGGWTDFENDDDYKVYFFEVQSGSLIHEFTGYDDVVFDIEFSPDGAKLAVARGSTRGVQVYDLSTLKLIKNITDQKDNVNNIAFASDGRFASVSFDGSLRIYDGRLNLIKENADLAGEYPFSLSFTPDGTKVAVGFDDSWKIQVLNSSSLQVLYEPDISEADTRADRLEMVSFSEDGKYLYAGGVASRVYDGVWTKFLRRWSSAGKGSYIDVPVSDDTVLDIKALADGTMVLVSAVPSIVKVSPGGSVLWNNKGEIFNLRARDKSHFKGSFSGNEIGFTPLGDKGPYIFKLAERTIEKKESIGEAPVLKLGKLSITDWDGSAEPKLNGKTLTFLGGNEVSYSADISKSGKKIVFGTSWNVTCLDAEGKKLWETAGQSTCMAVKVSGDERVVLTAFSDGTIRWFRMDDGTLLLTLYVHPEKDDWIIWTPSGYYDCSPGAENMIGWHLNNGVENEALFYPISKFRNTYYRPDMIDFVLSALNENDALVKADALSNRKSITSNVVQSLPPLVSILSPDNGSILKSTKVNIKFKVVSPFNEPVTGWLVQLDGRPYELYKEAPVKNADGISEVSIELTKGASVGIIAVNRHGYSDATTIQLELPESVARTVKLPEGISGGNTGAGNYLKPKLYALVIGVSAYKDPDLKLNLAAKDAKDFATLLAKQKGGLYEGVEVKLLTDDKATKDNILDGLEWLEKQVTQKDVGIMFLSGHGKDDNAGNFYYLPVGADIERMKSTCLNKSDIMSTIQNLSGKALLFMDACHSGSVGTQGRRGSVDMTGLINELIDAQNGAIVFTSSRGNQYSLENESWGNGAFTKALLEGFSGKAAVGESTITTLSLGSYIMERVKEITGGKQHPTFNQPPNQSAFPIAVKM